MPELKEKPEFYGQKKQLPIIKKDLVFVGWSGELEVETKSKETIVQVIKTYFTAQGGRLSLIRVWQGELTQGITLNGERASGIYQLKGQQQIPLQRATTGSIVALGKLEAATGDTLRSATNCHGRYKHQSGGHGAFGDVYLNIKPLNRGG